MVREKRIVGGFIVACEALAAGSLISTGDILLPILVLSFPIWLAFNFFSNQLPRGRYTTGILVFALIPIGLLLRKANGFQALETAAQIAPLLQLAIFLLPDPNRARQFRLANTFVITSLAAGLSPELLTGTLILLYFVAAFITLLLQFVLDFSGNTLKDLSKFGRWRSLLFVACGSLAFITVTALVFPMIPRLNVSHFVHSSSLGRLGLSGEVDLQGQADPSAESTVALRIEVPEDAATAKILDQKEFLKAGNLDSFDGRSWYTSPGRRFQSVPVKAMIEHKNTIVVQREILGLPTLPIFYGASVIEIISPVGYQERIQRARGNLFRAQGSSKQRITYRATLPLSDAVPSDGEELPIAINSSTKIEDPRFEALIQRLSPRIFQGEKKAANLISRLERFLKQEGFRYSLEPLTEFSPSGYDRFEKFMVSEKIGHCELFATAAALLLRKAGVPTRLAAGFRLPLDRGKRFIVLRNSDAHVWVEVWDAESRKWIAYDPTPPTDFSAWQKIYAEARGLRDDLEAYWYRYVVDSTEIDVAALAKGLILMTLEKKWLWPFLMLGIVLLISLLSRRRRDRIISHFGIYPRPEIRLLHLRIEKSIAAKSLPDENIARAQALYQELRFGPFPGEKVFSDKLQEAVGSLNSARS